MKILSIDSSGLVATVALLEDDVVIAEYSVNNKMTHSQTLVPMLDEIKKMTDLDLASIDAIAVAKGPGSFTGLRIGSATVKGLGLALEKPVIPVGTVDALSYNAWGYAGLICPIMDARREQVYTGIYRFQGTQWEIVKEQCAIGIAELMDILNGMDGTVLFLGDGCPVYQAQIEECMKIPFSFAPAHMNRQRAAALGVLAMEYYKRGITESADEHRPEYLRKSQAEREAAAKEAACETAGPEGGGKCDAATKGQA
ncbi:MAG: tRNA (adenosine(37)-N6)-threonylcarbamoyltransferase complex dimerization subunit type 1 TsaB [Lachnospiraceae bacterium]|nr:tRNA (adenosine(37)-N6)-threonylcarbamoyltransferase complex dimerization subunit type 1 TsaB [Lachnospiraceae bacterium]